MPGFRYYKFNFTSGGQPELMLGEAELYSAPVAFTGPDITTPSMTVTADNYLGAGYEPQNAYNNVYGDGSGKRWQSNTAYPHWLEIDLGAATVVASYSLRCDIPSYMPTAWTLQGSNDNTNWTTIDTVSGASWGALHDTRWYAIDNNYTLSGTVTADSSGHKDRKVSVHRREDGVLFGSVVANATTGAWSIAVPSDELYFAVCYGYGTPPSEDIIAHDYLTPV